MTMMTMMTVIDNVVDHYTYQTRWGQKRTHAKIHPGKPVLWFHFEVQVLGPFVNVITCMPMAVNCASSMIAHKSSCTFVPMYKHLGTYYTDKHDLEAEIGVRIGTAWSAFQSISKPILSNKHLPLRVRSQLFKALILTKLFFGCGTWHTPTLAQCRKLRSVLWRMCQRLLGGLQQHGGYAMEELFVRLRVLDPRIYIAQERLRYAQALFSDGPKFAQHILHRERGLAPSSWFDGVEADLAWMRNVGAYPEHE